MFYEMNSKDDDKILDQLPNDIQDKFTGEIISKLKEISNNKSILDQIWKITVDLCKEYIESKWVNDLGIKVSDLLEDIRFHSTFIIYLSKMIDKYGEIKKENSEEENLLEEDLKEENLGKEALEEILDKKTLKYYLGKYYDSNKVESYPIYFEDAFVEKLKKWIAEGKSIDGFINSDLYYFILKNIEIISKKANEKTSEETNEKIKFEEFDIFYTIVKYWNECPFSDKYKFGMTFEELCKFYSRFKTYIEKDDDKFYEIIRALTVERFFNISFIFKLSEHISVKYNYDIENAENERLKEIEKVKKLLSVSYIKKLKNKKLARVGKTKRLLLSMEDLRRVKSRGITRLIEVKRLLLSQKDAKKAQNEKIAKKREAERLLLLSTIASIPMVLCRNKYLDIINTTYENNQKYFYLLYVKLNNSIYYLNFYLIPIMSRVYRYLLYTYTTIIGINDEFISNILKDYINKTFTEYNYEQVTRNYENILKSKTYPEAFQINVTETIYEQEYYRLDFDENDDDVFKCMSNIENGINEEILEIENTTRSYVDNFPTNVLYYDYLKNKKLY